MSHTEPTTKARPPQKRWSCQTSTAATAHRKKPVREIAFGVSRDSISFWRATSEYAPRSRGGFSIGGVDIRRNPSGEAPGRYARAGRATGSHAQASGRARASSACAASAETAAVAPPRTASNHQWLAVATTTNVTSAG